MEELKILDVDYFLEKTLLGNKSEKTLEKRRYLNFGNFEKEVKEGIKKEITLSEKEIKITGLDEFCSSMYGIEKTVFEDKKISQRDFLLLLKNNKDGYKIIKTIFSKENEKSIDKIYEEIITWKNYILKNCINKKISFE